MVIAAREDEVLLTLGAQNALWIAATCLLGPGRRAAVENPGYPGLRGLLDTSGTEVIAVDVDADGLPPDALPPGLDVVFTTASHQCPTNATMPLDRRLALLEAAGRDGFVIVEDDYEFEMSFLKPVSPALKSLDAEGRVVYAGSFSVWPYDSPSVEFPNRHDDFAGLLMRWSPHDSLIINLLVVRIGRRIL